MMKLKENDWFLIDKMLRKVLLFILAIGLVACSSNTIYKPPKDLIPKDTMVSLLTDMYIAKSAKSFKNLEMQTTVNYMPFVYDKYKIDSTRFIASNLYYTSKIDDYHDMFKQVKLNITHLKDSVQRELQLKDSIRHRQKNLPKKSIPKDSIKK